MKLDLAQYRSLAAFAQFASDLDKATRDQLTRGEKLSEITKQPQYQPLPVEKQVAILYAATHGKLDDVPTPRVREFESQFYRFLETERPDILKELAEKNALSDELGAKLDEAIERFRVDVFGLDGTKARPPRSPRRRPRHPSRRLRLRPPRLRHPRLLRPRHSQTRTRSHDDRAVAQVAEDQRWLASEIFAGASAPSRTSSRSLAPCSSWPPRS